MSHKTEDNLEIPMGTGINQPDGTRSSLLYNEYPFYLYQVSTFQICLFIFFLMYEDSEFVCLV